MGLQHAVLADERWPDRVLEVTEGRGVDVILDLVGGPYLEGNQKVVAPRGRHIVVGVPAGAEGVLNLRALMGRRASIRGTVLRARPLPEKVALAEAFAAHVLPGFATGELAPVIDEVFPAADVVAAHARMEGNENFGKLLLEW
jgi:NADPH:quinone reductase-like Zn-dependent oxidoreductase